MSQPLTLSVSNFTPLLTPLRFRLQSPSRPSSLSVLFLPEGQNPSQRALVYSVACLTPRSYFSGMQLAAKPISQSGGEQHGPNLAADGADVGNHFPTNQHHWEPCGGTIPACKGPTSHATGWSISNIITGHTAYSILSSYSLPLLMTHASCLIMHESSNLLVIVLRRIILRLASGVSQ